MWKTRVEASKVITNSPKTLAFVTLIPFDTFPWIVLCDLSLMKLGNNKTEKKKQDYVKLVFIEKSLFPKTWKPLVTKWKIE